MSVRIDRKNNRFYLKTKNTFYVMGLIEDKHLVHLYYGKKTAEPSLDCHSHMESFAPYYKEEGAAYFPDVADQEFGFFGAGDYRAEALKVRDLESGADTSAFFYKSAKKIKGRVYLKGLPCAEANEETETLKITLENEQRSAILELYYTVFPESDIISRYFILKNTGKRNLRIEKAMSLCLDIHRDDLDMISFAGKYPMERIYQRSKTVRGGQRVYSRRGASSHHFNPFIMLADGKATEDKGEAYGFNFVYSGSFLDEVEVSYVGSTRVLLGLGSDNFSYLLESGEEFCSPEAIMTYTQKGIGQVSRNMHGFVRKHILPADKFECRPVVLNSWEAVHFDINESLMIDFARKAVECGIDMLVMDDGWFGKRANDRAGLGDWTENRDRFPEGLASFTDKIKAQGVKLGIWIEPEMVNPDSDLYRAHPDWILKAPECEQLLSRHQYVLDMANPEVVEYLKASFEAVFGGVAIDYFKWDMNRNISCAYSPALAPERQGEVEFRYMLGTYELLDWFTKRFPNAMIETCSGGGGRYDLGMMKYGSQIWTSDNTDPDDRVFIQHGSSFGYPAATMSCHVANLAACENKCFRDYAFAVAANGTFGYEMNILNASDTLLTAIQEQIRIYRGIEKFVTDGDLYRLLNPIENDGKYAYYFSNESGDEIVLTYLQVKEDKKQKPIVLKVLRADPAIRYVDILSGERFEGAQLRRGITVEPSQKAGYARLMHLCRDDGSKK